tara:strand:+ start:2085 stop:2426 length:342 start_codon:yes stop_codon:yes gene_type:complete
MTPKKTDGNGIVSVGKNIVTPKSGDTVTEGAKYPGRKNVILRTSGFPETKTSKNQRHMNLFGPDISEWEVGCLFLDIPTTSTVELFRTRLMEFIWGMGRHYTLKDIPKNDKGE